MSAEMGPEYRVEHQNGVVMTSCKFKCTKCKRWRPASRFGLRFIDGLIRNQAQCSNCRGQT